MDVNNHLINPNISHYGSGGSPTKAFEEQKPKTGYNSNGKEHESLFLEGLDKFGHVLTVPASLWLKGFARVFLMDLKPGWWGQKDSVFTESMYRTGLVILGMALLPFAAVSTVCGGLCRTLASADKKDFIYRKASQMEGNSAQVANKTNQFTVETLNVALMPDFTTLRNCQRPTMERVGEVAEAIQHVDGIEEPDFICLQEAFHTEATEALDKKLQNYHVVRNAGHNTLGLNSGLVIASKHELSDIEFFEHPLVPKAGVDKFAHKGILLATASINGKRVVIANTHLNGGGSDEGFRAYTSRTAQIIGIKAHIDKYIKERQAAGLRIDGMILAADTNISPTYYDGRENGDLRPSLEQEWWLPNAVFKALNEGKLHIPTDLTDKDAWRKFKKEVKAIHEKLSTDFDQIFKERLRNHLGRLNISYEDFDKLPSIERVMILKEVLDSARNNPGGPFPGFANDLNSDLDNFANNALKGTTIDVEKANWGAIDENQDVAQPERVDFINVKTNDPTIGIPTLKNTKIVLMESKEHKILSDHKAVFATYEFNENAASQKPAVKQLKSRL